MPVCFTVSAWAGLIFQHAAWASTVVLVGLLMLMLTFLAEGLLLRVAPHQKGLAATLLFRGRGIANIVCMCSATSA